MKEESLRIPRETLYEQVWTVPMSRLAQTYGLSDVGLAKLCKKHEIPRPPRGYWVKRQHGKSVRRPALPASSASEVLIERREKPGVAPTGSAPPEVVVGKRRKPHPVVQATALALDQGRKDHQGLIQYPSNGLLNVRVTAATSTRALRVLAALVCAVEERGHRLQARSHGDAPIGFLVEAEAEAVDFSLRERVSQTPHELTDAEVAADRKFKGPFWVR